MNAALPIEMCPPGTVLGLAPLLRAAKYGEELAPLAQTLIQQASDSGAAEPLHDLALILQLKFQPQQAAAILDSALAQQRCFRLMQRRTPDAIRLLILKTAGDLAANTPVECLIEGRNLQVDLLYVGLDTTLADLPPHDLVFVGICYAEKQLPLLQHAAQLLQGHNRPVLNRPAFIPCTGRAAAWEMLGRVPGIAMAATRRLERSVLEQVGQGAIPLQQVFPEAAYPIIIRPPDLHAGNGLEKIDGAQDLANYLVQPDFADVDAFHCAEFVNYQDSDGLFRKYRIVLTRGQAHLCHMGISTHWVVHYPYPEMLDGTEKRREEAEAMAGFETGLGQRHAAAFTEIARRSGLDYIGFDCAETHDGRLLIFEIATGMVIHDMDDPVAFPYKLPQMHRTFDAFNRMLCEAANYPV